jgi:hypothetical protein
VIAVVSDPSREQDLDLDIPTPWYISPLTGNGSAFPVFGGFTGFLQDAYFGQTFNTKEYPDPADSMGGRTGVLYGANWEVISTDGGWLGSNRYGVFQLVHSVTGVHLYVLEGTSEPYNATDPQVHIDELNAMRSYAATLPGPVIIAGDFNATFNSLTMNGYTQSGEVWLSNEWPCTNNCAVYNPQDIMNYLLIPNSATSPYTILPTAFFFDPAETGTTCAPSPPLGQIKPQDSAGNGVAHTVLGGQFNMCTEGCSGNYPCAPCGAGLTCSGNTCVSN